MNDNNKIDALYDRVMNVVTESRRLVEAPHVSDMGHITTEVQSLCKEINALPVEARVTYEDKLKGLFAALHGLEEELKTKRDEVAAQLSEVDTHKKAHHAYAQGKRLDDAGE